MSTQKITTEDLSDAELAWLNEQREFCTQLIPQYVSQIGPEIITVSNLHHAFDNWLQQFIRSLEKKRLFSKKVVVTDPNTVALTFGVAFGDCVTKKTGLVWKIVTDEFGTGLMLFAPGHPEGHSDIVTAPIEMVSKRIERQESSWLEPTFKDLTTDINRMMNQS